MKETMSLKNNKRLKYSSKRGEAHRSTSTTSEVRGVEKTKANAVITEENGPDKEGI